MSRTVKYQERKMTRRSFLKRGAAAAFTFFGLSSLPFYSYFGERNWVETVRLELKFAALPRALDGAKLVLFSDIHYGFYYGMEQLRPLIERINAIKPDLLVLAGDLFEKEVAPYAAECVQELSRLTAKVGKFAVPGNHDYLDYKASSWPVYEKSGFTLLVNKSETLRLGGESMHVVGVDDMFNGNPDLPRAFRGLDRDTFTLLLAHEPDYAKRTGEWRVDLQLSGHSHGGQVRLPFIGPVMTVPGGRTYVEGLYSLADRAVDSYVYTTRGIGTTHIPVRLLCRPELTVITLLKA